MKSNLLNYTKLILADRPVTLLLLGYILVCMAYCAYVGLSLQPSDLQVAVHYTAFGEANFYRDKWYYFLSFILFGITMAVIHTSLAVKLYTQDRRQFTIFFILLSLLIMVVAWAMTHAVLGIAFL